MKIATYSVVPAEIVSVFSVEPDLPIGILIIGGMLGIAGDIIFAVAVVTMRDSWREGIAEEDNWILLFFSVFAAVMLHLQILQEEKYLPVAFGEEYISYKKHVCRYLGRKG